MPLLTLDFPRLQNHPKVDLLAISLKVSRYEALAYLIAIWGWVADNNPDGLLLDGKGMDRKQAAAALKEIVDATGYRGSPSLFMKTVIQAGLVDQSEDRSRLTVHDWSDWNWPSSLSIQPKPTANLTKKILSKVYRLAKYDVPEQAIALALKINRSTWEAWKRNGLENDNTPFRDFYLMVTNINEYELKCQSNLSIPEFIDSSNYVTTIYEQDIDKDSTSVPEPKKNSEQVVSAGKIGGTGERRVFAPFPQKVPENASYKAGGGPESPNPYHRFAWWIAKGFVFPEYAQFKSIPADARTMNRIGGSEDMSLVAEVYIAIAQAKWGDKYDFSHNTAYHAFKKRTAFGIWKHRRGIRGRFIQLTDEGKAYLERTTGESQDRPNQTPVATATAGLRPIDPASVGYGSGRMEDDPKLAGYLARRSRAEGQRKQG
jgi:hypothetical protein